MVVMDFFEGLGVERRLVLDEEALKEVYHAKSREEHPDVAGSGGDFENVAEAYAVLRDPVRRLKHWLELEFPAKGEKAGRDLIGGEMLELFGEVNAVLQAADELLKKRAACKTAMGRATLAGEETARQQALSVLGMRLAEKMEAARGEFEELDGMMESDRAQVEERGRELARRMSYLAKWIEQVREKFAAFL
jgi:curved DNA-binding protein CbpA